MMQLISMREFKQFANGRHANECLFYKRMIGVQKNHLQASAHRLDRVLGLAAQRAGD
jgi:hypothetical protein